VTSGLKRKQIKQAQYMKTTTHITRTTLTASGINYKTLKAAAALKRLQEIETMPSPHN
jgi:hypothetical protein